MNCEAYIAYLRGGMTELHPRNTDPDIIASICAGADRDDTLLIRRAGDMVYHVYMRALAHRPGEYLCTVTATNRVAIDLLPALHDFFRTETETLALRYRIACPEAGTQATPQGESPDNIGAARRLREAFNARFKDKGVKTGPVDYTKRPGTDRLHIDADSNISRLHSDSNDYSSLSTLQSLEAGNTLVITREYPPAQEDDTDNRHPAGPDIQVTQADATTAHYADSPPPPPTASRKGVKAWPVAAMAIILVLTACLIYAVMSRDDHHGSATDNSDSQEQPYPDQDNGRYVTEEETVISRSTPAASYLNLSETEITVGHNGGYRDISISTDGDWHIDKDAAPWVNLTKYSNSVTLFIEENTSSQTRTDNFVIKAGDKYRTVNITQYGDMSPAADIQGISMTHNVYRNGQKGMEIHVSFDVKNMRGETIYVCANFYYEDNITILYDPHGNHLSLYNTGTPGYDETTYRDFTIFVPYSLIDTALGSAYGSTELTFDIVVRDMSGKELTRDNNSRFTYTKN